VLYWKKFFDFKNFTFYLKWLCCATSFSFRLSFDDKEAILGNQIAISSVLVLGGVVLCL
jgi:undecaprenyl-diphosphatase